MKDLYNRPFYETLEPRPDFEQHPEALPRQPHRRTLSWQITLSYPSPPMSSPPSPQRKPIDNSTPTTTSSLFDSSLTAIPNITYTSGPTVCLPSITAGAQALAPLSSQVSPFESATITAPPPLLSRSSFSSADSQTPLYRTESASSLNAAVDPHATAEPGTATASSASGRGGRRSKSHVANACNNCKRAHLSCDVERPCNRCVQTGKADTCRDVPHKKRGRPRLRDEGSFTVQQHGDAVLEAGPSETVPSPMAGRGMAASSRHRRTGSLRALRSHTDMSGTTPVTFAAPQPVLGPAFVAQPSAPRSAQSFVTPTAFLDLDLNIMKANKPFLDLMGIPDIRGMRLTDIAKCLQGDSFQNTRNALRAEREAKEPSYLPPIYQPGLNPVSGITDQDIDEITRGFDDQRYNWTFRLAAGERTLAVRMRLAKTSLYFVTLFLPPLPEVQTEQVTGTAPGFPSALYQAAMPAPPPPRFQSSPPQLLEPTLASPSQATPSSPFYRPRNTYPAAYAPLAGPPLHSTSRTYPPFGQQPSGYYPPPPQQSQFHMIHPPLPPHPLQAIQERPQTAGSVGSVGSAASSYVPLSPYHQPSSMARPRSDTLESLGRHVQNRLRADSGVTPSTVLQSSPPQPRAELARTSSDESAEAAGQGPKKRRRMNLDDVLHQE